MHRTLAIVTVLALSLWLAAPSLASAQEPTPPPASPVTEPSSGDGSFWNENAGILITAGGALLVAVVGAGAAIIRARSKATRDSKKDERERTKEIWKSYDTRIRLAEERGDKDAADKVRLEYEQQQVAWQAQQGIERITPIEISAAKDEPALAPEELADLRELLDQAKALAPALLSAQNSFLRGNAYYRAEQYEQALAAFDRALELRPDDPAALANRGVTFGQLGRYEDALADLKRSLELRPDHATTIYNRGLTFNFLERHEDALADYNRSVVLRPDDAATLMNRGVTLHNLYLYDNALTDLNRALELRPDHTDTLMNRGVALIRLGRPADALADLDRSLELRSDHAITLTNRAGVLIALERYQDALDSTDRSLKFRPDDAATLVSRAISLHHLGRRMDALASYGQAIELEPRNVLMLLNRASLRAEMGDAEAATEDLGRALSQADLAGFRRRSASEAASHPYFEPLRADPTLRKLFEEIVGEQPGSA